MAASSKIKNGGGRKIGREIRKKMRKGSAISLFTRNKITAAEYFKQTNQGIKP